MLAEAVAPERDERYPWTMHSAATADEMLTQAQALPLREKLRLIEGLARQVADATPEPPAAAPPQSRDLLGLFADEPNVMDEVMRHVREERERSKTHPRLVSAPR